MALFCYIVTCDSGFAPNPFWGYITLACCKPQIRRSAEIGDWVVGLSPKKSGNRIIYSMRVEEILPVEDYFKERRFQKKKAIMIGPLSNQKSKQGDNIYEKLPDGNFRQHPSRHSSKKDIATEDAINKKRDLGGKNVLISKTFYYFGSNAIELPDVFHCFKVGRGHKKFTQHKIISTFEDFISKFKRGINGKPIEWKKESNCLRMRRTCR